MTHGPKAPLRFLNGLLHFWNSTLVESDSPVAKECEFLLEQIRNNMHRYDLQAVSDVTQYWPGWATLRMAMEIGKIDTALQFLELTKQHLDSPSVATLTRITDVSRVLHESPIRATMTFQEDASA